MLKGIIRLCEVTLAGEGTADYPQQQIEYMEKTANAISWFPYGFHANLPPETLAILFAISGVPEARVFMGGSPKDRPLDLESGEVAFFHPSTGSEIRLKANGDIQLTAPNVNIVGNLDVSGTLDIAGATSLGATVTSNGTDISDTHTHVGSPTAPSGSQSNTGVPV